jgi:hypothetical protein
VSPADRVRRARIAWRLAGLPVRLTVLVAAAAAGGVLAVLALSANDRIDSTAASLIVAIVVGITTVWQQRQVQRRQHTIALLSAMQTDRLADADEWMAQRIAAGRAVADEGLTDREHAHVMVLLDYYEFLAVLAMRGLVDVPLLLDLRGGAMGRCYRLCEAYITTRRASVSPGLYACLDIFTGAYTRRGA